MIKKARLNPFSQAMVWEKEKRATLFLEIESPDQDKKKPIKFKVRIGKMICPSMVGRVADMLETAMGWHKIEGFSDFYDKREELTDLAKRYLLKDFPEEKNIEIEIFDIEPNGK